ncbi:MAG: hypothetical protein GX958_02400 [Desulfitobacterium sp.]|nr:hypothetical protein [Desulfitobacterium sp.]
MKSIVIFIFVFIFGFSSVAVAAVVNPQLMTPPVSGAYWYGTYQKNTNSGVTVEHYNISYLSPSETTFTNILMESNGAWYTTYDTNYLSYVGSAGLSPFQGATGVELRTNNPSAGKNSIMVYWNDLSPGAVGGQKILFDWRGLSGTYYWNDTTQSNSGYRWANYGTGVPGVLGFLTYAEFNPIKLSSGGVTAFANSSNDQKVDSGLVTSKTRPSIESYTTSNFDVETPLRIYDKDKLILETTTDYFYKNKEKIMEGFDLEL